MRALIVTDRGVQDQEATYPYYRLQEAGMHVDLATPGGAEVQGIGGLRIAATIEYAEAFKSAYDLLVIPGGVKAMERMRLDDELVRFVADFPDSGGVVASMCSGAQMLISANLCRGRVISCYPAMRVDVENAGATFHPGPAVTSGGIVTSPHYRHLGAWMAETLRAMPRA